VQRNPARANSRSNGIPTYPIPMTTTRAVLVSILSSSADMNGLQTLRQRGAFARAEEAVPDINARLRLCSVSIDLDEIYCYTRIHGLGSAPESHAVYDTALPRIRGICRGFEPPAHALRRGG